MNKIETYAVPFTAYEENDRTADHDFIAFWEVEHRDWKLAPKDYATAKGRACNYEIIAVPEYTMTYITVVHGGYIAAAYRNGEDLVGTVTIEGSITLSNFDLTVREMVADLYYDEKRELELWECFYDSCEFGQMVSLTSPFKASIENVA